MSSQDPTTGPKTEIRHHCIGSKLMKKNYIYIKTHTNHNYCLFTTKPITTLPVDVMFAKGSNLQILYCTGLKYIIW